MLETILLVNPAALTMGLSLGRALDGTQDGEHFSPFVARWKQSYGRNNHKDNCAGIVPAPNAARSLA